MGSTSATLELWRSKNIGPPLVWVPPKMHVWCARNRDKTLFFDKFISNWFDSPQWFLLLSFSRSLLCCRFFTFWLESLRPRNTQKIFALLCRVKARKKPSVAQTWLFRSQARAAICCQLETISITWNSKAFRDSDHFTLPLKLVYSSPLKMTMNGVEISLFLQRDRRTSKP